VIAIAYGASTPPGFPDAQTVITRPGVFVAARIAVSVTGAAASDRRLPTRPHTLSGHPG
jgi:hypothetical protein